MPNAISYQRFSSTNQKDGESLSRQNDAAVKWIAEHPEYNLTLSQTLTDAARSAYKGKHIAADGELGKFIEAVNRGVIPRGTWLIVEALDRLSRETVMKATHQLSGLVLKGIVVVTTIDNRIYDEKAGVVEMVISVAAMASAYEFSKKNSIRIIDTKRKRVQEAQNQKIVLSAATVGWLKTTNADRISRRYELVPHHVETVKLIFEMALTRGSGYITQYLIENNIPNIGTKPVWNNQFIRLLLKSHAPLGHLQTKHGLIENLYPKIIDEDLWLRVQAAMKSRVGKSGAKDGDYINLFARYAACHECGGSMRIARKLKLRYYECINHATLHNCPNKCSYRVDILEEYVLANLAFLSIEAPKPVIDISQLTAELADLRKREAFLTGRLKRVTDDVEYDIVMSQIRELQREITDTTAQLSSAQQTMAASEPLTITDLNDRVALHAVLQQRIKSAVFHDRNEVLILGNGFALVINATFKSRFCRLLLSGGHDETKMAVIENGRLAFMPAIEGLPKFDPQVGAEILRLLKQEHQLLLQTR